MDEILKQLVDTVVPILGTAIASLLTLLVWKARQWADTKIRNERFHCATEKINVLVNNAIAEAEQVTVRALRDRDAWTPEAAVGVRDAVVNVVKRHLGTGGIKDLVGCLGIAAPEIEGMICTMIEANIQRAK